MKVKTDPAIVNIFFAGLAMGIWFHSLWAAIGIMFILNVFRSDKY